MIVQIFSIGDFLVSIVMLFLHFSVVPWNFGVAAMLFLMVKWYMWRGDIASIIDLFVGVYILLLMLGVHTFLTYIFVLYLWQKVFFGFLRFS